MTAPAKSPDRTRVVISGAGVACSLGATGRGHNAVILLAHSEAMRAAREPVPPGA